MTKRVDNCKQCGVLLTPINSVYMGIKRYNSCHNCHVLQHRAKKRENNFIKNYGITQLQYDMMNALQSGGCAICKQPCTKHTRLSVDHDHKTGVFRGLLCHRCNSVLGFINDDEDLLWDILEYLKKHRLEDAI